MDRMRNGPTAEKDRPATPSLHVFCAGVSLLMVKTTARQWNESRPELPAVITAGGSVDLIRRCISGERCDLLISADDEIIRTMMFPQYADGYRIWAGNKMVICGENITAENWEEKLLTENATFKHKDPYGDPGGYRAVMAILLADLYKPGLTERLMNHPGHAGMEKKPNSSPNLKPAQYEFVYRSGAIASGKNYAELPAIMDLSDPSLAKIYKEVSFAIDHRNTVTATPIAHAITIPKTALHKNAAKKFGGMFLAIDKEKEGFLPREAVIGKDPFL